MNKNAFEKELRKRLSGLSVAERQKILDYYDELYYEKLENGESEPDIIKNFGKPADIVNKLTGKSAVLDDYVGEEEDKISEPVFKKRKTAREYDDDEDDDSESSDDRCDDDDRKDKIKKHADKHADKRDDRRKSERFADEAESVFTKTTRQIKSAVGGLFTNKTFWIIYFSLFFITVPLTIAFFSVVFALAVAAFSIVFAFVITGVALTIAGPFYVAFGLYIAFSNPASGVAHIGAALVLIALGILFVKSWTVFNWIRLQLFVKKGNRGKPENKKNGKSFRAAGALSFVLFIVGCGVFALGFNMAGWDYKKLSAATYTAFVEGGEEVVTSIDVNVSVRDIKVIKSSNQEWRVESQIPDGCELSASVIGGVLKVLDVCDAHKFSFNFIQNMGMFSSGNLELIIYVPDTAMTQIKAKATTGSFRIDGFKKIAAGEITVTTGSIRVYNSNFETLAATATTGSIRIENSSSNTLEAKATTGNVTIKTYTANSIEAKATTGSVYIEGCEAAAITAEGQTGSVRVLDVTANYIKATATTGSVKVEVIGKKSDYDIKSSTTTGSNNAGNQDHVGDKKIIIRATTGNVRLSFK